MPQTEWENLASLLSLVVTVVVAIALAVGIVPQKAVESIEFVFRRLAARRSLCFVLIPALSLAMNVGITLHNGIPRPKIHDEFSYLLAADTFAHGRLTNPTPPFFEHFETPHELMRPTRMSKYPPGQGIALMLGQVVSGEPIIGEWLVTALACGAIYWMLLAFVRLPWALVGGTVAALNPELLDWSQVYWGGSVAVLGGALALGAWGRLMVRASPGPSILLGIGLAVLANSRPFEGFLLAAPLVGVLVIQTSKQWPRALAGCAGVLLITGIWMAYYDYRITGHALRLPYAEYTAQYDAFPKFWFQPLRTVPEYRNRSQKWVHTEFGKEIYESLRTGPGFARFAWARIIAFANDNLKFACLLPALAAGIFLRQNRRIRWIIVAMGTVLIGLVGEHFGFAHYSAPANAGLLLLAIAGWARIWRWEWQGRATGRLLARAMAVGFLAGAGMSAAQGVSRDSQVVDQQQLVSMESALQTGRHLIFVEYSPMAEMSGGFANEYVYNSADLDQSQIIWARYFGPEKDRPVAEYFSGRQVWSLYVGGKLDLQPYLTSVPHAADYPAKPGILPR